MRELQGILQEDSTKQEKLRLLARRPMSRVDRHEEKVSGLSLRQVLEDRYEA